LDEFVSYCIPKSLNCDLVQNPDGTRLFQNDVSMTFHIYILYWLLGNVLLGVGVLLWTRWWTIEFSNRWGILQSIKRAREYTSRLTLTMFGLGLYSLFFKISGLLCLNFYSYYLLTWISIEKRMCLDR